MAFPAERHGSDEAEPETLIDFGDSLRLAAADIEVTLVDDLSSDLHRLFDPVTDATLPIYFGPLLGRLYLEGL